MNEGCIERRSVDSTLVSVHEGRSRHQQRCPYSSYMRVIQSKVLQHGRRIRQHSGGSVTTTPTAAAAGGSSDQPASACDIAFATDEETKRHDDAIMAIAAVSDSMSRVATKHNERCAHKIRGQIARHQLGRSTTGASV